MDLRIIKTKKAIREAFIELRDKTSLEKVRVKEICDLAMINKSTFYKHYRDVFHLSEEIEGEVLEEFFRNFQAKDCLFTDPKRFILEMPKALAVQRGLFMTLFKGRAKILFHKIERTLKTYYDKPGQSEKEDILLTFVIGGTFHTLHQLKFEERYDDVALADNLSKIITGFNVDWFKDVK